MKTLEVRGSDAASIVTLDQQVSLASGVAYLGVRTAQAGEIGQACLNKAR